MIDVHQGVAVNALKAGASQPLLRHLGRLGSLVSLARGGDPDDVALGMECENLAGVEQEIFGAGFAHDLLQTLPGELRLRNFPQARQPLDGLLACNAPGLLDSLGLAVLPEGLQRQVGRIPLERKSPEDAATGA
jgi:hypothetical protein